jgi:hypothetical protein
LDDLRAWTSGGTLQDSVPVYLNEETFAVVSRAFPYLVSKANATGGGEVASFQFTMIKGNEEFEVAGLDITPLPGKQVQSDDPNVQACWLNFYLSEFQTQYTMENLCQRESLTGAMVIDLANSYRASPMLIIFHQRRLKRCEIARY